jgi:probable rRNA maturation factor
MILLDPDLDPDPRSHSGEALQVAVRRLPEPQRLPTPRTLTRFLARAQAAVRLRGEVSVLLTTDRAIRRLNRQFRGKDKATDVLSFPAQKLLQSQKKKEKGDLAISVDTARRQSVARGHSLQTEIRVLILHGLLHLAGYDHEADRGRMARREHALRARLRLPQGLIERAESESAIQRVSKPARRPKL